MAFYLFLIFEWLGRISYILAILKLENLTIAIPIYFIGVAPSIRSFGEYLGKAQKKFILFPIFNGEHFIKTGTLISFFWGIGSVGGN